MGPPDNQDPAAERGIFLFLRRGIRGLWPLENLQPLAYLVDNINQRDRITPVSYFCTMYMVLIYGLKTTAQQPLSNRSATAQLLLSGTQHTANQEWGCSSAGEHFPRTEGVGRSNRLSSTILKVEYAVSKPWSYGPGLLCLFKQKQIN